MGASSIPKRKIGFLTSALSPSQREDDFRAGLRELGWIEGDNLVIEYRRAGNSPDRMAELAKDLVTRQVELIVASTTTAVVASLKASPTIPIVTISADPVGNGFAESLHQPGGSVTGISTMSPLLSGKRLELLRELRPRLRHIAFLGYRPDPTHKQFIGALEDAGRRLSIEISPILLGSAEDLMPSLLRASKLRAEAVIAQTLLPIMGLGQPIAEFALQSGLLTCSDSPGFVAAGGLLSYGYDPAAADKRVAIFVDRILKGGHPSIIPIEMPQRFRLVLNRQTAARLGLRIPESLRLRTDQFVG